MGTEQTEEDDEEDDPWKFLEEEKAKEGSNTKKKQDETPPTAKRLDEPKGKSPRSTGEKKKRRDTDETKRKKSRDDGNDGAEEHTEDKVRSPRSTGEKKKRHNTDESKKRISPRSEDTAAASPRQGDENKVKSPRAAEKKKRDSDDGDTDSAGEFEGDGDDREKAEKEASALRKYMKLQERREKRRSSGYSSKDVDNQMELKRAKTPSAMRKRSSDLGGSPATPKRSAALSPTGIRRKEDSLKEKDRKGIEKKLEKRARKEARRIQQREEEEKENEKALPRKILQLVLLYASPRELGICCKVQRRWKEIAESNAVWKRFWEEEIQQQDREFKVDNWKHFHRMSCKYLLLPRSAYDLTQGGDEEL